MDQFFTPTRRLESVWEEYRHFDVPVDYAEVQLAIPVEEFLIYRWTWADLRAFVTAGAMQKIVWITKNTFLSVDGGADIYTGTGGTYGDLLHARSTVTISEEQCLVVWTHYNSLPTQVCSIFWRAITTRNSVKLTIQCHNGLTGLPQTSGPVISQFFGMSRSLKHVEFVRVAFKKDHCRAFAGLERTDLAIVFRECGFQPKGAQGAFIEWLPYSPVVTDLDTRILSALSGNSSVRGSHSKLVPILVR
jgi:hypothetical protein